MARSTRRRSGHLSGSVMRSRHYFQSWATCRSEASTAAFADVTPRPGTRRPEQCGRELGVLQAAVNFAYSEGYLTGTRKVRLPKKSAPRDRWLTRDRSSAPAVEPPTGVPKGKHLARFILVALYTGTRSNAVLSMRFMPNTEGGWCRYQVKGTMHRRGARPSRDQQTHSAQRRSRAPLLAHLRRWERTGGRYVVEVGGQRVASVKTAWKRALADANEVTGSNPVGCAIFSTSWQRETSSKLCLESMAEAYRGNVVYD